MIDGKPFIILQTRVAGEMLFISMENSYDGTLRLENGQSLPEDFDVADTGLLSSKHDGVGTGLQSVSSICRSHQGSASFTVKKNCFRSEICIRL